MKEPTWNGTPDEVLELIGVINQHCHHSPEGSHCQFDSQGRMTGVCDSHTMLAKDQRALNGLILGRRMTAYLMAQEFDIALTDEHRARLRRAINE